MLYGVIGARACVRLAARWRCAPQTSARRQSKHEKERCGRCLAPAERHVAEMRRNEDAAAIPPFTTRYVVARFRALCSRAACARENVFSRCAFVLAAMLPLLDRSHAFPVRLFYASLPTSLLELPTPPGFRRDTFCAMFAEEQIDRKMPDERYATGYRQPEP